MNYDCILPGGALGGIQVEGPTCGQRFILLGYTLARINHVSRAWYYWILLHISLQDVLTYILISNGLKILTKNL